MDEYHLYEDGKTIIIHPGKCLEYLKNKAKEGDDQASYLYGKLVFEGDDVAYLPETGILYMLRAAMNGHILAKEEIEKIQNRGFKYAIALDGGEVQFVEIDPGVKWEDLRQDLEIKEHRKERKKELVDKDDELHARMSIRNELSPEEREKLFEDARLHWGSEVVKSIWNV